jgi:tetratricopeptide (TPR) repeat protein
MRPASLALVAVLLFSATTGSLAQENLTGKYVVVKNWNAKFTENGRPLNTHLELGDSFYVSKVEGDKVWVGQGWLKKEDVVPWEQAIDYFTAELQKDASAANFHNRAIIHAKRHELDEAIRDQTIAIKLAPSAPDYAARAGMWQAKGDSAQAMADIDEAIRLDPNEAVLYNDRASFWRKRKKYDKAIADCDMAIRLNPKYVVPYFNRALSWQKKGEGRKAIAGFNEAIAIEPNFPWSYASLGWIWSTNPEDRIRDGVRAIASARKACDLTNWRTSDVLDTLAAANAESGDFEGAVKWENEALKLKLNSWSEKTVEGERARLELYKAGKPYREKPGQSE